MQIALRMTQKIKGCYGENPTWLQSLPNLTILKLYPGIHSITITTTIEVEHYCETYKHLLCVLVPPGVA